MQLAKSERNWRTLICKAIGRCRCPRTKTIIPRLTPLPVSSLSPSPPPPVNTGLIRGMPDYAYSPYPPSQVIIATQSVASLFCPCAWLTLAASNSDEDSDAGASTLSSLRLGCRGFCLVYTSVSIAYDLVDARSAKHILLQWSPFVLSHGHNLDFYFIIEVAWSVLLSNYYSINFHPARSAPPRLALLCRIM
jgi:hypothetical protein